MVRLCLIAVAIALAGCAAVPISDAGSKVRQIQHDGASPCKFIKVIEVTGGMVYTSRPEATRDMLAKLRNETAQMGGNAYAVSALVVERGLNLPFAQADAYRCP